MSEEIKNAPEKSGKPAEACPICGFITPFNPEEVDFCCPVCGSPSGQVKPRKVEPLKS